ncbi:MAG: RidA family protein [Cyclobacteriaceae bacterium]|jgi:enamine deaminase RidA (YjgF/YER057c/UK114 family)|nr:RidA family protein [Cyclobacteriaceae bacterium]
MRKKFSTGAKWEDIVGYSRAVLVNNQLEVTGTVAVDEHGKLVGKDNMFEQTRFILGKMERVINEAGFQLSDVTRTRIFVTDISRWQEVGKAHQEFFGAIKPATTMVEVRALISPEYLVEIEASAIKE